MISMKEKIDTILEMYSRHTNEPIPNTEGQLLDDILDLLEDKDFPHTFNFREITMNQKPFGTVYSISFADEYGNLISRSWLEIY